MNKNHFFVPVMRIVVVLYFIYKMAFSDPNLDWNKITEFNYSSQSTLIVDVLLKVLFGFIFISFIIYQYRQAMSEFSQKANTKDMLRLLSIVWSTLFYFTVTKGVVNVNLAQYNVRLIDYLTEFYTASTIVGVIAGIIATTQDIRIMVQIRKNKNNLQAHDHLC